MATPANNFRRVSAPDPSAITVIVRKTGDRSLGEVLGPNTETGDPGLSIGQDGSLTAHQAVAAGCHLANQTGREVVVLDADGHWQPGWGRLEPR